MSHSLEALDRAARLSPDVAVRLCAFLHDLGKLATAAECYPRHHGHDRAGGERAEALCRRLRLSTLLRRALVSTCRLHLVAARWPGLRDGTKVRIAEEARKAGIASANLLWGVAVASDYTGELEMAFENVTAALALDPLAPPIHHSFEVITRRIRDALSSPERAVDDPSTPRLYAILVGAGEAEDPRHVVTGFGEDHAEDMLPFPVQEARGVVELLP